MVKYHALFTGLFHSKESALKKIKKLKEMQITPHWCIWKGNIPQEAYSLDIDIISIDEPEGMDHKKRSIVGRQRQIFNVKAGLKNISDRDIVLKNRWDVDFNDETLENIKKDNFFEPISNGIIQNKIWVGYYSIQEMFSVGDLMYAGYKKDLDKLIEYKYIINGVSSDNYICHDGMQLMPKLIAENTEVCNTIKQAKPYPESLMFLKSHTKDEKYITCWAYSYHLINKYFKTGRLGTCFFKRGDTAKWPGAIVDYNNFDLNYQTVISNNNRINPQYPRYRVYDDIFIKRLINGDYKGPFAKSIHDKIKEKQWL